MISVLCLSHQNEYRPTILLRILQSLVFVMTLALSSAAAIVAIFMSISFSDARDAHSMSTCANSSDVSLSLPCGDWDSSIDSSLEAIAKPVIGLTVCFALFTA